MQALGAADGGESAVDEAGGVGVDGRLEQAPLAGEVAVHRCRRHARLPGDVGHRRAPVAGGCEAAHGDLEQARPGAVALAQRRHRGHGTSVTNVTCVKG